MPRRYYTDEANYRDELERFYRRMWIAVGRADRIPDCGCYFLRDLPGESLIVVRGDDGSIRTFHNVCRHRGTRICSAAEGAFIGRIQCPYHAWTYALDGRLLSASHMSQSFRADDYPLHEARTAVWDGHVFVNLADDPEPLEAQLGDLPEKFRPWQMEQLRSVHRIVYDVEANWKLVVLNYNECLHCPVLHPALNRLHHYMGAFDNEPHRPTYVGGSMGFRPGVCTMSMDGLLRRDYLPGLGERERAKADYYAVYPNLLLSLFPDYMMTHTLWPRAVDRTEVVCEWHFHPDEIAKPGFDPTDAIEFWDLTNREDWAISRLSQLGIQSRAYTPGPYSEREGLLVAFDDMVRAGNKGLVREP